MLQLQLQLQPQTEERLKRVLAQYHDQEVFAQNIIAYQIADLKKSILNIRLDLQQFEQKYLRTTEAFYRQFTAGIVDDTEDFIVWAGIYEMLQDNERQLENIR